MEAVETTSTEGRIVKKTVETSVSDDGATVITEETTVIEVNGDSNVNTDPASAVEVGDENKAEDGADKSSEENSVAEEKEVSKEVPEEASETQIEAQAAEQQEAGDAVTASSSEEKKPTPKVILHQFPPSKNIPSLSSFCLKLETFLRLHKIPYENQYGYKMGKNGKLPWIEYLGERKADSNLIIEYLNEKFEINSDDEFTPEQRATGRAVRVMAEENTYWAMSFHRYLDNFNEFKKFVAPASGGGIGFSVSMKMNQRKMKSNLEGHGIGKHTADEIYNIAKKDLSAISTLLGDQDFILGDKPSSYDCALFGLLANILWCGLESPLATFINENAKNLTDYIQRVKELCWLDWEEMILGEKQVPTLKKGFSFRKKKARNVKPKEKDQPTETDQNEESPTEDAVKDSEVKEDESAVAGEVSAEDDVKTKEEGQNAEQ